MSETKRLREGTLSVLPRATLDAAVEEGTRALNRIPPGDLAPETARAARAVVDAALPVLLAGGMDLPREPSEEALRAASDTLTGKALFLEPVEIYMALRAAYRVDSPPATSGLGGLSDAEIRVLLDGEDTIPAVWASARTKLRAELASREGKRDG